MRRILAAIAATFAASVAMVPAIAWAEPLEGYSAGAVGSPVSILLYEPVIPIPSEPQLELDLAYTRASLDTGPTASALASTVWPGDAVGQGLGTLIGQEGQDYPVKSTARHPGGPRRDERATAPGSSMTTETGERAAESQTRLATIPPQTALLASARSITSTSTARLAEDESTVTARATARATDLLLLGGLIRIDQLRVTSVATSDGEKGTADGGLTVAGLSVLGQTLELGPRRVRLPTGENVAVPRPPAGSGPGGGLTGGLAGALEAAGISIGVLPAGEKVDGPTAEQDARPLVVSVDTRRLRRMLDAPLQPVVDALPEDTRAELAPALALAPRIDFVVGNLAAAAAGTPTIGGSGPSGSPRAGAEAVPSTEDGDLSPSTGTTGLESDTVGGGQEAADLPVVAEREKPPYSFGGIPAALVVGAALGSVLAGWALRYVALLAGGGLDPCDLGLARGVPNLREGAP